MIKPSDLPDAIERGDLDLVKRLLGAYPDQVQGSGWVPPPLHCCVLWNQVEVARLLLARGADIEQRDPDQNTTPLRYAVIFAKPEMLKFLIQQNACTGKIDPDGQTALQLARDAAEGAFEEFEDLPKREAYEPIIEILSAQKA